MLSSIQLRNMPCLRWPSRVAARTRLKDTGPFVPHSLCHPHNFRFRWYAHTNPSYHRHGRLYDRLRAIFFGTGSFKTPRPPMPSCDIESLSSPGLAKELSLMAKIEVSAKVSMTSLPS